MNKLLVLAFALFVSNTIAAQSYQGKFQEANYDESKVPDYSLPKVLSSFDGKSIQTVEAWESSRRPEIVDFFAQNMFGEVPTPSSPIKKSFQLIFEERYPPPHFF